ncbi:hypothetical protein K439DRAFT_989463 [Ramaria rubella]|nr:hypothetical protein K439DRAFT_989463 [Ramaria rubella]
MTTSQSSLHRTTTACQLFHTSVQFESLSWLSGDVWWWCHRVNFTTFSSLSSPPSLPSHTLPLPILQFDVDMQDCSCAGWGWHQRREREHAGVLVVWLVIGAQWGSTGAVDGGEEPRAAASGRGGVGCRETVTWEWWRARVHPSVCGGCMGAVGTVWGVRALRSVRACRSVGMKW